MMDRHDPMVAYASTALVANQVARALGVRSTHPPGRQTGYEARPPGDARATFGRVEVTPNGTNAVPSSVRAWLDARAADEATLERLVRTVHEQAKAVAKSEQTEVEMTAESVSPATVFDPDLASRLSARLGDAPVIPTGAGHDAGVLALAGVPTAMLFVRNPTGVSHSPAEHAEMDDCLAGVDALTEVVEELAGGDR